MSDGREDEEAAIELDKLDKLDSAGGEEPDAAIVESDLDLDVQRPLLSSPPAADEAATTPTVRKQFRFADTARGEAAAEEGEADNLLANRSDTNREDGVAETNLDDDSAIAAALANEEGEESAEPVVAERSHVNLIDNIHSVLPRIKKLVFVVTLSIVLLFALLIIVPNCLFRLEYNQLALTRNAWTGSVRYDRVYGPGIHFILPWYEGIAFDKSAHRYKLDELNIFTTDKLSVKTSWIIYYFLDEKKLGKLYRDFAHGYRPVIEAVSKTVLLNHGSEFSIDDYRTRRAHIRNYLRTRLKSKLETQYGLRVLDVYLGRVTFTREINQLNLLRMLNGIYNEKAAYDKQTNVTRAETQFRINRLRNEARLTLEAAHAKAINQVRKIEEANRFEKLELTHLVGLNNTLRQLKFYEPPRQTDTLKKCMSFCYLSSLINNENVRFVQRAADKNSILGLYVHDDDDDQNDNENDVDVDESSSASAGLATDITAAAAASIRQI